ncbi:MAG: nucleoside-diphosphate kinase [Thermodesulfovibrionales bacterium]|nr:nucleoside-diphosphate kinase [Thermodesulfovibrionales bacterium]
MQRTLSIIKPDGVKKNIIGEIISRFEKNGLRIAAIKKVFLSKEDAKRFYIVHKERPFYDSLTDFMSEGPIIVMVLEGEDAIIKNRDIMGATNPANALPGTIRRDFAQDVERNIVHGSDSPETAKTEIAFFFSELEIL